MYCVYEDHHVASCFGKNIHEGMINGTRFSSRVSGNWLYYIDRRVAILAVSQKEERVWYVCVEIVFGEQRGIRAKRVRST